MSLPLGLLQVVFYMVSCRCGGRRIRCSLLRSCCTSGLEKAGDTRRLVAVVPHNLWSAGACPFNAGTSAAGSVWLRSLPAFCPDPCRWRCYLHPALELTSPPRTTITPPLIPSQLSSHLHPWLTETPVVACLVSSFFLILSLLLFRCLVSDSKLTTFP